MPGFLISVDNALVSFFDSLSAELQTRFRLTYPLLMLVSTVCMTALAMVAFQSTTVAMGSLGWIAWPLMIAGIVTISHLMYVYHWKQHKMWSLMTAMVAVQVAQSGRTRGRTARVSLVCLATALLLFNIIIWLDYRDMPLAFSLSQSFLCIAPFIIVLYLMCSLPVISDEDMRKWVVESDV